MYITLFVHNNCNKTHKIKLKAKVIKLSFTRVNYIYLSLKYYEAIVKNVKII